MTMPLGLKIIAFFGSEPLYIIALIILSGIFYGLHLHHKEQKKGSC